MARNNIGFGFGSTGDKVSKANRERSAKQGNEAVKLAAFAFEYRTQIDALATAAEIRAAYERSKE